MADVKQIEVNGVTYDIHDATARSQIADLQQSVSQYYYKDISNDNGTHFYWNITRFPGLTKMFIASAPIGALDNIDFTNLKSGNTMTVPMPTFSNFNINSNNVSWGITSRNASTAYGCFVTLNTGDAFTCKVITGRDYLVQAYPGWVYGIGVCS